MTFDDWVRAHANRNTDVDGAYGAQCWDLWAAYACDLCGADMADVNTPGTGSYAGLAGGVYADFPRTAHLPRCSTAFPRDSRRGRATLRSGDTTRDTRPRTWPLSSRTRPTRHGSVSSRRTWTPRRLHASCGRRRPHSAICDRRHKTTPPPRKDYKWLNCLSSMTTKRRGMVLEQPRRTAKADERGSDESV